MFDPIKASKDIKKSYIDYITTTFDMADPQYKQEFLEELKKEGMIAKGPFLDIGGSFEVGHTLQELIEDGCASPLFEKLEPVPEKDRELKLRRPLYLHQESSLLKASAGENLVVTTGTGSGKTESFLIPILRELATEAEAGTLCPGVRALLIYPMNALANDQTERLRSLLSNYPEIKFGVYTGQTKQKDALPGTFGNENRLEGLAIGRKSLLCLGAEPQRLPQGGSSHCGIAPTVCPHKTGIGDVLGQFASRLALFR